MGQIWAIISTIRQIISVVKTIMVMIADWQKAQLDRRQQALESAVSDLKKAESKTDREKALEDVAKNSL
jgi:hypothetical protein